MIGDSAFLSSTSRTAAGSVVTADVVATALATNQLSKETEKNVIKIVKNIRKYSQSMANVPSVLLARPMPVVQR